MGHARVSVLASQAMATKGELLKKAIAEAGLTPKKLGEKLGYANPYLAIQSYISGEKEIGERVARKLADGLDLPGDFFTDERGTEERVARNEKVYLEFLGTPLGEATAPDDRAAIRRLLPALRAPTVEWLSAFALHLRGQGPMPSISVTDVKAALRGGPQKPKKR